jgi:hypothetical protein
MKAEIDNDLLNYLLKYHYIHLYTIKSVIL